MPLPRQHRAGSTIVVGTLQRYRVELLDFRVLGGVLRLKRPCSGEIVMAPCRTSRQEAAAVQFAEFPATGDEGPDEDNDMTKTVVGETGV